MQSLSPFIIDTPLLGKSLSHLWSSGLTNLQKTCHSQWTHIYHLPLTFLLPLKKNNKKQNRISLQWISTFKFSHAGWICQEWQEAIAGRGRERNNMILFCFHNLFLYVSKWLNHQVGYMLIKYKIDCCAVLISC